jgi:monoamine oxidase
MAAARVLVTVPLALLQASPDERGAIEFTPALPADKQDALKKLEMGKVVRLTMRFRTRFWEDVKATGSSKSLGGMSFLFSDDEWFPTWWTAMPSKVPIITGWAPFRSAERLSGRDHAFVVESGVKTLSRLLGVPQNEVHDLLGAAYFHDWQSDPLARGAYSYGKVGGAGAHKVLAQPLEDTLFFAGEATDVTGSNGTVHGAISSGQRAAREILATLQKR